jgi:hypothetical protein
MRIDDLAELVRLRPVKQLGLLKMRELFHCKLPADSHAWVGDSIDVAATLFDSDTFDDCKALSSMRRGNLREVALRFSQKTKTHKKQLNISVTAPSISLERTRSGPFPVPAETFIMVETRQGRFCAKMIPRPESSTKLFLSNLAQAVAENSTASLLHPPSTRITSHSLINAAVERLKG